MSLVKDAVFSFLHEYETHRKDAFVYALPPEKLKHFSERIQDALEKEQSILLWGDYDVDGIGSTTMLAEIIDSLSLSIHSRPAKLEYTIPTRSDGYGISIDKFRQSSLYFDLIITLDNGSHAEFFDALSPAEKESILIFDHHPNGDYEKEMCVMNPNPNGDVKISTGLLVQDFNEYLVATIPEYGRDHGPAETIDLCAMTLISDMASLNSDLVRQRIADGLVQINTRPRAIFSQIFPEYRGEINMKSMAFELIPVINSIGRLHDDPSIAVEALIHKKRTRQSTEVIDQAVRINELRKEMTDFYTKAAYAQIEARGVDNDPLIFVHIDSTPIGINGLIASNIFNRYGRDTIVSSRDFKNGGCIVGSGRGNNVKFVLNKMAGMLDSGNSKGEKLPAAADVLRYGGHNQAVGVKIYDPNVFEAVRMWTCANVASVLNLKPKKNIKMFDDIISIKDYNDICETYSSYTHGDIKFNDSFYVDIKGMVYAVKEYRNDFVVLSIADEEGGDIKVLTKRQNGWQYNDLETKVFSIEVQPLSGSELTSTIGTSLVVARQNALFSEPTEHQENHVSP